MSGERKRGFLRPSEDNTAESTHSWGLPDYTSQTTQHAKETAFNYDPSWSPTDEPEVDEAPLELTEEQIEIIKQGAYQEGLFQGQEAGFKQGYDKGKEEGLAAGHAEGLQQGQADGVAAGEEYIKQQVDTLMELANQFAQPLELVNNQVEKQLVDMVLALTKEVVHVEVQTNPQIILDTVKQSLDVLPVTGHAITLKMNPVDVDIIRAAYGDQEIETRNWTLVVEPSLNRGDLFIEAGESSVSYKMEDRIKSVLQSFCGTNRHMGGE
ncbi:flagellar assembly protein FliH [Vibrio hippocampi]|uniref:Flagellar assembly protein FliH n=1 Tax=Vibrio hippocampi TaxID=654686 RepID=A0ABN8DER8_9VIBR|nr:flagellar assembly protein FliH [Vibrio hippocampi]CAH0525176.1 hypothetical protein VHP8226_00839 [Vibrio hippocampi]